MPNKAQPPPPFTVYGVYAANPGWSIEWLDGVGNVTQTDPITGWMFGQRTSDTIDLVVPLTAKYPVFFSQQTQPYRLVAPREQNAIVDPNPAT
jgi:hypothetical protein